MRQSICSSTMGTLTLSLFLAAVLLPDAQAFAPQPLAIMGTRAKGPIGLGVRCAAPPRAWGLKMASQDSSQGEVKAAGGLRTKAARVVSVLGACLGLAVAAPRPSNAEEPRITLPSQEAYSQQMQRDALDGNPVVRVVKDPRFLGAVGVVAAGGGGYYAYQTMERKKADQYRAKLKNIGGVEIDASILDEGRINRPGAKTFEYSGGGPKFGTYRAPPEKKMVDVRDKYVWNKEEKKEKEKKAEVDVDQLNLNIWNKKNSTGGGAGVAAAGATAAAAAGAAAASVEVVGAEDGPKTAEQKALEQELDGLSVDEIIDKAVADPSGMDPSMMAAALPALQAQLSEVLKDGISPEEVQEVKQSFREMGIDLEEMFASVDQMEQAGMADSLGSEGREFFKTLRKILDSPVK